MQTKSIQEVQLAGQPPLLREIFNLVHAAGAEFYANFGGAPRDADYAARRDQEPKINDYDLRIWLDERNFEERSQAFVNALERLSGETIRTDSSPGTGRPLYRFTYKGIDLDISVRPMPLSEKTFAPEAVAIERAGDSDIGISSVAIDPLGRAWATKEYLFDQENRTLTVYPIEDAARRDAYAQRMQGKFPDHRLIFL